MKFLLAIFTSLTTLGSFGAHLGMSSTLTSRKNPFYKTLNNETVKPLKNYEFYWYSPTSPYSAQTTFYWHTNVTEYFYWEINVGPKINVRDNFVSWSAVDPYSYSSTWASWGKEKWFAGPFRHMQDVPYIDHYDLNTTGEVNNVDIANYVRFKMQDIESWSGAAWFRVQQWVGLSTFKRNRDFYVSVYGYQTGATSWSVSGGDIYISLGTGISFALSD